MKKLKKISINPEKVIKNEELVNLRGGYDDACTVVCYNGQTCYGYLLCVTPEDCSSDCEGAFGSGTYAVPSTC